MTGHERAELNETRQVLDDAILRVDRSFVNFGSNDDLAQSMKALLSVKKSLESLAVRGRINISDGGEW